MRDLLTSPAETIEADFAALQTTLSRSSALESSEEPDATTYWSHLDVSALNVISHAHIAPADVPSRVPQLMGPYLKRGLPFLWMTTPTTTSPALEATLAQAGLSAQEFPAMHCELDGTVDPRTPDDVYIDVAWPDQVSEVSAAIFNGFGRRDEAAAHHLDILETMESDDNQFFIARSMANGEPLGASTMHSRGNSVMFANISTLPAARGRGVGRALTATMMNRAASTGAASATLVATSGVYPLYVDLGFRTQFNLVTWTWDPRTSL